MWAMRLPVTGVQVRRELVQRAMQGDEDAFTELARSTGDRLFSIAYRIVRDVGRAEDAVQQTLVIAWRQLPTLRDVNRFDAWLHRLLVNACYAEFRRGRTWTTAVHVMTIDPPAPSDDVRHVADRDQLER